MLQIYLSVFWSYYINRCIPIEIFKSTLLVRLVQGARNFFSSLKYARLLIISDLLTAITPSLILWDDINMTMAFKLAFAGFLCMGKFTHIKQRAINSQAFTTANLIYFNIWLAIDHAIVRLKYSKTNRLHQGVTIIVIVMGEYNYPVHVLK